MKRILLATALCTSLSANAGTLTGFVVGSMMNGGGKTAEQVMTFSYNPNTTIKCDRYTDATKVCALDTKLPKTYDRQQLSKCVGYNKCYPLDTVVKHITGRLDYKIVNITRFSKYTLPVYIEIE